MPLRETPVCTQRRSAADPAQAAARARRGIAIAKAHVLKERRRRADTVVLPQPARLGPVGTHSQMIDDHLARIDDLEASLEDAEKQVRLLTNNPAKLDGLAQVGIDIVGRVPLHGPVNADNRRYLTAKATRAGHKLDHLLGALT